LQYAVNIPYRMAAADGHEKSVLRAAMGHLLPASVVARRKSPYPRTQDVAYVTALQNQAAELLVDPGHEAFSLVDANWVRHATSRPAAGMDLGFRMALERLLDIGVWLDAYRPMIKLG
jgi:asparagine synthase (glutamine-hydrolysing)